MIYFDNAATTLKKPRAVVRAMNDCMKNYCANSGRGTNSASARASEKIFLCREAIASLFGVKSPENIVFTPNATTALNIAIRGILDEDSHVVISKMEHNSLYRPAVLSGAEISFATPFAGGIITAESIEREITPRTKLIAITHASNIVGTINPIREIGMVAKRHNIPLLVDCAQTAGSVAIDVFRDNVSMLAFAGHKGLYGPTGTGGLYISPDITLKPFISGGTGSASESAYQPDFLPDRFEAGTLNTVGIVGLLEGVRFVEKKGVEKIHQKETEITNIIEEGLSKIPKIKLYTSPQKVGITSFSLKGADSVEVANTLSSMFDIACRGGLHCAPLAHHFLGTYENGLVRLSASYFNTSYEAERTVWAIKQLLDL